ncbi:MAG: hypothetical protein LBR57_04015 [Alistipes sp.]|jgi:hypothetical protein|nr:hypothetical protein [Alistipes sp.]
MKKLIHTVTVLVAIGALASSCVKGVDNNPDNASSAVKIGIYYGKPGSSRAVGDAISGSATRSPLVSGHIFFYNSATGLIDKHVGLNEETITPNESISDLEDDRVVVVGVDGNADRCMIIFNDNDIVTASMVGRSIADVKNLVILTSAMNDDDGGIASVPLKGDAGITSASGTNGQGESYTREVVMDVTAMGTRLQVGGIAAGVYTPAGGGAAVTITAFTVEGVFVNHTHSEMTVDRLTAGVPQVDYMQDVSKYVSPATPGSGYAVATVGERLADIPADGAAVGSPLSVVPGDTRGRVWAYNLVPATVPHFIVRLSGIEYREGDGEVKTLPGDKWLTVAAYHMTEGDTSINEFLAGNVYMLSNLVFDWSNLTDLPETQEGDVRVYVNVIPWLVNDIHWGDN